jgi:hypothetical protein
MIPRKFWRTRKHQLGPSRFTILPPLRQKRLDAKYYITRVLIPPLDRIFGLLGADVRSWYDDMPKAIRSDNVDPNTLSPKKVLIERMVANVRHIEGHFQNSQCILCGSHAPAGELTNLVLHVHSFIFCGGRNVS